MLTKKDKQWIQKTFQEGLKQALFRKITIEKGHRKQGDPEIVTQEIDVNVLDFLVKYLPDIEGRLLGMQEDVDKTKNKTIECLDKMNLIGNALIDIESSAKTIALLADIIKEKDLLPMKDVTQIELKRK